MYTQHPILTEKHRIVDIFADLLKKKNLNITWSYHNMMLPPPCFTVWTVLDTKCQNGRLGEYLLKHSLCLKWMRTVGRKSDVCQYIVLK